MKNACLAFALLVPMTRLLAQASVAAAPPATAAPLVVDVHSAPYRPTINYTLNIGRQRFDLRHATVFDMVEFAFGLRTTDYTRENPAILGGPTWIDLDRFDVVANVPSLNPQTIDDKPPGPAQPPVDPYERIRPILKRVLAERFHLAYHMEDRPLPAYVVTAAPGGVKMSEAKDPAAPTSCHGDQDKANPMQYTFSCTSETVAQFLTTFGGAFPHPVIDRTGLTKSYDISLKLTMGPQMRTQEDMTRSYADAFNKQLGLFVTQKDVPQPAIVVEKVDRTPAPNAPDIAKLIPPLPDLEFEVASIKLAAGTDPRDDIRPAGSQITFSGFNLQGLLIRAWQLPTGAMLGDALPLLPPTRYTILVKLPPEFDARVYYQDQDQIASMLQKLLVDRFRIKYHWGEWTPPDATILMATPNPKMKKADPNSRSFCKRGPAEGEKDILSTPNSPYDREFHCQNVTMAQFADLMQPLAATDVKTRVPDRTGLAGAYDFSLYYTSSRTLRAQSTAAAQAAAQNGDASAVPAEGIGLPDAFRKQLGLRIERQPLTLPALVLDHFEQTPTEN